MMAAVGGEAHDYLAALQRRIDQALDEGNECLALDLTQTMMNLERDIAQDQPTLN